MDPEKWDEHNSLPIRPEVLSQPKAVIPSKASMPDNGHSSNSQADDYLDVMSILMSKSVGSMPMPATSVSRLNAV